MSTRLFAITLATYFVCSAYAADFMSTLEFRNGANDDLYASGQVLNGEANELALWRLETSVSDTDFRNLGLEVGEWGVEYSMRNPVARSTDENQIRFSTISTDASETVALRLAQSVYTNDGIRWNGGYSSTTQFMATWDDSNGPALLSDPDGQILDYDHGDLVYSPAMIRYSSNQVLNTDDSWSLAVPAGDVDITWSSHHGDDGTALIHEWISFTPTEFVRFDSLSCDGDADLDCDVDDLALMYGRAGESVSSFTGFDFDGDGVIGPADIAGWLQAASEPTNVANPDGETYSDGDTNLDTFVKSDDLGRLLNNFDQSAATPGSGVGWNGGDLDMDGDVDSTDLGKLLNNFKNVPAAAASAGVSTQSVPEPSSWVLLLISTTMVFGIRRRTGR